MLHTQITCGSHHASLAHQVLRFIYTDEVEEGAMEAMADHLLVAAMKYQLGRLQVMSEMHLSKTLMVSLALHVQTKRHWLIAVRCMFGVRWRMQRRGCFWQRPTAPIS